jgi:hypothetical protein
LLFFLSYRYNTFEKYPMPDQPSAPRPAGPLPLLRALNQTAASLRWAALTRDEVFQAVTKQITALGLQGNIGLIDADQEHMTFAAMAFTPGNDSMLSKIIRKPLAGFRFNYKQVDDFRRAVEERIPLFTEDNSQTASSPKIIWSKPAWWTRKRPSGSANWRPWMWL